MIALGEFIESPNGSVGIVIGVFPSGRLDVEIVEKAGHHKKGDRLVWLPPGVERDEIPANTQHGVLSHRIA